MSNESGATQGAADCADVVHSDLLQFCLSSLAKERVLQATEAERRDARNRAKTYRALLIEEMQRAKLRAARLPPDGKGEEVWVLLMPKRKPPRKLCAASVAELLQGVEEESLRRAAEGGGLIEALTRYLRAHLQPRDTGEFGLRLKRSSPGREPVQSAPSPPAIAQMGTDLIECTEQAKKQRKELKQRVAKHEEQCRQLEPSVESYIKRMGPEAQMAPLQMEVRGQASSFFVRKREQRILRPLGLKVLLQLAQEVLREVVAEENLPDDVNAAAVGKLRSPELRDRLYARLQERVEKHRRDGSRVHNKITLEKGRRK